MTSIGVLVIQLIGFAVVVLGFTIAIHLVAGEVVRWLRG